MRNRITIVYVIDFLSSQEQLTGGTERQLIEMVNSIDKERFRPIVFCLQEFFETPYWSAITCEKHILNIYSLLSLKGITAFLSFISFLKKNTVDIVQTYFHDSTLFGIPAGKFAGVKKTISCRRDLGFWYEKKLFLSMAFANKLTDRILVNSSAIKDVVINQEKLPAEKIDVIHNGLDLEAFDSHPAKDLREEFPQIEYGDKIIGMVANYNRKVKRVDLFIRAAAEVAKKHSVGTKFLIIGGGRLERELKKLVKSLGMEGKIIMGGPKEPAIPYIKSFDIGVLSSDSEGFSNVLLEYMAAGIPVVATDVGGNREILDNNNKFGQLVPKNDYLSLSSTINGLLEENKQRNEMGRAARKNVVERYTWPVKVKEFEDYYNSILFPKKI